jgi:dimeric dUTPase (all-alpha-NTP-PPase superfamily)
MVEVDMQKQLAVMLQLQDKMNKKVHPQWVEQNFAWFRAIWIECGELVDHYGYKWWKKQTPDMQQVQLEVVDIWHFGLSMLIDGRDVAIIAAEINDRLQTKSNESLGVIDATEALAESILATRKFDVTKFWVLLEACDMSFDNLFKQYVGKNVLNFFRQDHGYKEGTYIKQWHGREDNEHLSDILNNAKNVTDDFAEQVYQQLEAIYKTL